MSGTDPTASALLLQPFRAVATSWGLPDALLAEAGCPVDPASPAEFPEAHLWRYLELVTMTSGDRSYGLACGDQLRMTDFGCFGRALEQGLTLHGSLRRLIRTVGRVSSHAQFWLEPDGDDDDVWLCRDGMRRLRQFGPGRREAEQFTLLFMLRLVRQAAGASWRPNRVKLQMAPDEALRDHEALHETSFRFDAEFTAVALPRRLLVLPNITWRDDSTSAGWRRRMSGFWDGGLPRLDGAAAMLGTSARTLQRRLQDDGLTYELVTDQMKLERAFDLLSTPMPLVEVSRQVGYEDQAHFTRAFKRWTGTTPGAWRMTSRAGRLT